MPLCTADEVVRYAALTDPDWDALEEVVQRACAAVEAYCRRAFALTACDERYDAGPSQDTLVLRNYPVAEFQALHDGLGGAGTGQLIPPDAYLLNHAAGTIRLLGRCFIPGPGSIRAVYTAGYSHPPLAVVQAAIMLAADWYRNRPDGRALAEGLDGYTARYSPDAIPPQVAQLLEPYRRRVLQ